MCLLFFVLMLHVVCKSVSQRAFYIYVRIGLRELGNVQGHINVKARNEQLDEEQNKKITQI